MTSDETSVKPRFDPLVGTYRLPPKVEALLYLPEVQRLKDIRLLNIFSPTFEALSETARLSHSMAVVGLSERLIPSLRGSFSAADVEHWQVSLLIHDLGTPPFGHLLEYRLHDRWGWRHDSIILDIIYGRYRPENIDDQIYYGNQLKLFSALNDLGLQPEALEEHIAGESTLGQLISGGIDLDNIDTVFRMAAFLGLGIYRSELFALVDALRLRDGQLEIDESGVDALRLWVRLRQIVYDRLLFDVPAVSLQAMMTDAFDKALDMGVLSRSHWRLTDHEVLQILFSRRETRHMVKRVTTADYYQPLALFWFDDPHGLGKRLLTSKERLAMQHRLSEAADIPIVSYPFADQGTRSKHLEITVVKHGSETEPTPVSEQSRSFVIGFFTHIKNPPSSRRRRVFEEAAQYLHELGLTNQRPLPSLAYEEGKLYEQGKLPA